VLRQKARTNVEGNAIESAYLCREAHFVKTELAREARHKRVSLLAIDGVQVLKRGRTGSCWGVRRLLIYLSWRYQTRGLHCFWWRCLRGAVVFGGNYACT
jgi:hypothetical protein